jgi:glutathione S-transferase
MSPIIFFHNPQSRAVMAHWMLEEVGADYDMRVVSLEKSENKSAEFLAINPMGKLPTIVVEGTAITETPAIIAWLADAYPAARLAPPIGSPERGSWYRWLFFGGSCIEPAMIDKMFDRPDPPRKGALGWGSYDDVIDTLEEVLDPGPWLVGDAFSAADVYVGSELNWATMFKAPRIAESRILGAYLERIRARPALQRATETNRKLVEAAK